MKTKLLRNSLKMLQNEREPEREHDGVPDLVAG